MPNAGSNLTTDAIDTDGQAARLEAVKSFIDGFTSRFRTAFDLPRVSQFVGEAHAKAIQGLKSIDDWQASTAPRYNVFHITHRSNFEVTTHSRFLANLLNPIGEHEQGPLFLSGFLEMIRSRKPGYKCPPADRRWIVEREYKFIDIRLSYPEQQAVIVIENKWFAGDQPDQTRRYWEQQQQETKRRLPSIPVIYLAPHRREPDLGPRSELPAEFLADLMPISYAVEIHEILEAALPLIRAVRVRETVAQYLELMGTLDEG